MVTKQQQLEWLVETFDMWPNIKSCAIKMSVKSIGCEALLDGECHTITRSEWQQERDKMSGKPEVDNSWYERGERPPVGALVEKKYKSATIWTEVKIIAAGNQLVIFAFHDGDEMVGGWSDYEFRPLRTEREKAIDEMVGIIKGSAFQDPEFTASILYDAGYRKVKP